MAALALPRVAWGQGKRPLVGVLVLGNPPPDLLLKVFRDALRKRGYIEGETIAYAVRSARGKSERLPEMASELVDIIVAWQTPATAAAKAARAHPD